MVLTEDGMLLKRRAQEIIELADKAQKELTHKAEKFSARFLSAVPRPRI